MKTTIKTLIVALAASLSLSGCITDNTPLESHHEAKEAVRGNLKDPDSAKFKDISVEGFCTKGLVNAKNSSGGYTGFKGFGYNDGSHRVNIREDGYHLLVTCLE